MLRWFRPFSTTPWKNRKKKIDDTVFVDSVILKLLCTVAVRVLSSLILSHTPLYPLSGLGFVSGLQAAISLEMVWSTPPPRINFLGVIPFHGPGC